MPDFEKNWRPARPESTSTRFADRLEELRSTLRFQDPGLVAARSGVSYLMLGPGRGELHIPFWGNICIFSWPQLIGYTTQAETLPDFHQALLLYYLVTANGSPLTGKWVSFADLPDGRMYNAAFQGYSGDEIVKRCEKVGRAGIPPERTERIAPASSGIFDNPLHEFGKACLSCGGQPVEIGSASFLFQALPRVPLMVTYWLGDEDFPSSCKILFDASASHYLPIDACAILGSTLTRQIVAGASHLT
jgi:hypothetical protein